MRRLCLFVLLLAVLTLAGCASGYTRDGREVRGVLWGDDGRIVPAAEKAGGIIGGIFAGPTGATIGTAVAGTLATAATGLFALRRGERRGWDEADDYHGRALDVPKTGAGRRARVVAVRAVEEPAVAPA